MNDDLAQTALAAIQKLERENALLREELSKARAQEPATLGDAIAKVLDPVARQVSKSRGRVVTAEEIRKSTESGIQHDLTYAIRKRRAASVAAAEKRR